MTLEQFVIDHSDDDCNFLLLGASRWPGIDVPLAVNCIASRRKLRTKVPQWYEKTGLIYPNTISAEQCSSSATAEYKTEIAINNAVRSSIADLTGGLGVDSWFFSKKFGSVLYNEMDSAIAESARHNFKLLGADNVFVSNQCLEPGNLSAVLDGFSPGILFLDPARRSASGGKVFLIEDCSPDVLALKDELLDKCPVLMVKLSPMADISMVQKRLGNCREIHVVSSKGECKELLVVMERDYRGDCDTVAVELPGSSLRFSKTQESDALKRLCAGGKYLADTLARPGTFLFEPGKSLLKAGASAVLCERFSLSKLGRFTSLYVCNGVFDEAIRLGKVFELKENLPLNKASMKEIALKYPQSEVSAKNIPLTSDQLRRRMHLLSGEQAHIFGAFCEGFGNRLLVCKRIC